MPKDQTEFFESKDFHPWSRIKDSILGFYMSPYVAKVVKRGKPLLLIDAFAGPGLTNDGEPGSPFLMCQAAEKYAAGRYQAIFINKERKYHERLTDLLKAANWHAANAVLGDSATQLQVLSSALTTESVFLYVDPFGLSCEFDTLKPFIERVPQYSTEIFINLNVSGLHRLAAREAFLTGSGDPVQIEAWHNKLTRTLGGDYWKPILLSENIEAKERERMVVEGYKKRLSSTGYLKYTGSCPVQKRRDGATKYHIIFASPHPDAMVLLNDAMCKAFNKYMIEEENRDTLFASLHWEEWRDTQELENIVVDYVSIYPGRTRKDLWPILLRDHFMRFMEKEYRAAVKAVVKANKIECVTPVGSAERPTTQLNDNCVLQPK